MASGFKNGCIKLDSSCYYSGQVVQGSVVFDLNAPLTFSALNIEYHGEAKVMWTEEQTEEYNGVKSHGLVKYQGHEEYFKITQCLAGGTGVAQLPPGPQEFKFSFQIPHTAPSSFGGDITYHINAYMYYPEPTRPRDEITQVFDVVAPFDLNLGSPAIKQPLDLVFEEVYGCDCICSASPVTIHVRLPASGFCPGQVIPISIEAQNESTVEITKMIFQLVSREAYRSKEPIAEYIPPEKVLVTVKKGPVMSKSKRNFTCEMVVPDMIVPNLENCGIIDISYFFKTTIKLSGCNDDLQDESEIYLGLVPLRELVEGEYVHPMAHSLPKVPIPNPNDIHINPGFLEPSNTPYSTKTQFDAYRNSPTPTNRAPNYVGSTEQIPLTTNPKPFTEIGFKVSEAPQPTQYPMANSTVNAPYPSNKWGTQGGYPYPKNPGNQVPGNTGAIPSAPPAYS